MRIGFLAISESVPFPGAGGRVGSGLEAISRIFQLQLSSLENPLGLSCLECSMARNSIGVIAPVACSHTL